MHAKYIIVGRGGFLTSAHAHNHIILDMSMHIHAHAGNLSARIIVLKEFFGGADFTYAGFLDIPAIVHIHYPLCVYICTDGDRCY
jgi:hypothetical protein